MLLEYMCLRLVSRIFHIFMKYSTKIDRYKMRYRRYVYLTNSVKLTDNIIKWYITKIKITKRTTYMIKLFR